MSSNKFSRRDFLKGVLVTAGTAITAAVTTNVLAQASIVEPIGPQWLANKHKGHDTENVMQCVGMTDINSGSFRFPHIQAGTTVTEGSLVTIPCDPIGWGLQYVTLTDNFGRVFYTPTSCWRHAKEFGWVTRL